jgi:hypothetical protein
MDVSYTPSISIAELPTTDPIHNPCPDMAGCTEVDPNKRLRSLERVANLRKELALESSKRVKNVIPERFRRRCNRDEFVANGLEV